MTDPVPAPSSLADQLREAVTVLDEPFHREAVSRVLLTAAERLDALEARKSATVSKPAPSVAETRLWDNHHNALTCPYCNPERLVLIHPARLREYTDRAEAAEEREARAVEERDGIKRLYEKQAKTLRAKLAELEAAEAREAEKDAWWREQRDGWNVELAAAEEREAQARAALRLSIEDRTLLADLRREHEWAWRNAGSLNQYDPNVKRHRAASELLTKLLATLDAAPPQETKK